MKRPNPYTLIIFLLLLSQTSFAQAEAGNEVTYERVRVIPLNRYKIKKQPDLVFPLQGVEVVVNVWDSSWLGFAQVGMANKKIRAHFDTSMQLALQQFVDKQYSSYYTPSGGKMLWVINDLRINERTFMSSERAYVYLSANAYLAGEDGMYRELARVDTVLQRGGLDVTGRHEANIGEVLHLLFVKSIGGTTGGEKMSRLSVLATEEARYNLPILTDYRLQEGVYTSFKEFKNNAPSIRSYIVKPQKRGKVAVYQVLEDGKEIEVEKVWGLCHQNELYKVLFGELIPLEQVGRGFMISDYLEASNRRNRAMFWASMLGGMGGAIGAGIGSGIASTARMHEVTAIPYIKYNRPEASCINMQNGTLSF